MSAPPEAKRAKGVVSQATCTAPVNIAVIKYWGKRDAKLLLPINSSLSGTLSQDELHARTSVAASADFEKDQIWLNGVEEDINNKRLQNVLAAVRARAAEKDASHPLLGLPVRICSKNNFPTAAGLASSAAGYACLVAALAQLFGIADTTELSSIARVGSGSACRSMYGGFVRWTMGERDDGVDSIASQVVPASHWPEMEVLILVVNEGKKGVSSSSGMQTTVATSPLIKHRADVVVPERMRNIEAAIEARDFETFARITMEDSNQFHATCLDTYPPIFYMNDVSKAIVGLLTKYNACMGEIKAAYTFDAGPNCVIYARAADVPGILALVNACFPSERADFFQGRTTAAPAEGVLSAAASDLAASAPKITGGVKYILHTGVGDGPRVIENAEGSLLDQAGNPKP